MLPYNLYTFLDVYWLPCMITACIILIAIFLYRNHKKSSESNSYWSIFLKATGIKKSKFDDTEVEEYHDKSGRFQFGGFILLLIAICALIASFSGDEIPQSLLDFFTNYWFWGVVILLGLLIFFRKNIFKIFSGKKPTWVSWKNGFSALGLVLAVWLALWIIGWLGTCSAPTIHITTNTNDKVKLASYPRLNMNGSNTFKKRVWKQFTINRGEATYVQFEPVGNGPFYYLFQKINDTTQSWGVKAWRNSAGELVEEPTSKSMPYAEALIGEVRVCITNTDAVVVVSPVK